MSSTTPEPFLTKPFVLIGVVIVFALGHVLFGSAEKKPRPNQADSVYVDSTYVRLK